MYVYDNFYLSCFFVSNCNKKMFVLCKFNVQIGKCVFYMVLLDVVFSSLLFGNGIVLYYIEKILIDLKFFEFKGRLILW